ncbi:putative L1 protein [Canis familiaris papillomavirus 13]|uniref:Major capsid protein L1 n=1 Tax=Canis familiaris papillomavirus 13 TaxID=1226723 RepID=J7JER2_9PAPI|nr:putative L1 protein [Canis familiaris papillomavirus 13]AFQ52499.1 putative L1 protein [Canis familiaris papillomavirus 13]
MNYWVAPQGKLYLPPPNPVSKVFPTDEYVTPTNIFYLGSSERLLTVGNPHFEVRDHEGVTVPKVSGNQFRVFRLMLPDPNKFALQDPKIYDPDNERLVWRLQGIEIGRGGPLGFGTTGNPLANRSQDAENTSRFSRNNANDERTHVASDPKQTQMFIVGCRPCLGAHWDVAKRCVDKELQTGECPPLELVSSEIEDGQMCDIGYGALNFKALDDSKATVPMEIAFTTCKWPDFLKMNNDTYGDSCFFYGKREQVYCRHMFVKGGTAGEKLDAGSFPKGTADRDADPPTNANYFATPSGSLVSSDTQLFNRPYWLSKAQGRNNGVCWQNNLFVTVMDNTRNTNFSISVLNKQKPDTFESTAFNHFTRHVEEFEISVILMLCKVSLTPEVLSHIHAMDPNILEDWNLGFVPPPANGLESTYRFINSLATKCPADVPAPKREDPYAKMTFWNVDLKEKLSLELDQHSLGRKFLSQGGLRRLSSVSRGLKRPSSSKTPTTSKKKKKLK